jgi:hypothetical protein
MQSPICHCQNVTMSVAAIEAAMFWFVETSQCLKVLNPIFVRFISRYVLPRFILFHFITMLTIIILIGFSILQAEMKSDFHFALPTTMLPTPDVFSGGQWDGGETLQYKTPGCQVSEVPCEQTVLPCVVLHLLH